MAATACALLALLRPGDHLLSSKYIYGGTYRLFMEEFVRMGIDVQLVDPWEPRVWRKNMRKETRAIFLETPVNPTCRVLDLRPISFLTRNSGIALVVDSTFASPINFRPIEHGADVVIHSATKYLNGHHDVLMARCSAPSRTSRKCSRRRCSGARRRILRLLAARTRPQDPRRARAALERDGPAGRAVG